MPQQRRKTLCRFCKHFKVETLHTLNPICDAFPDRIPDAIYRSWEFDHREPYQGDNGIQFERETDHNELKKRFPRIPDERMNELTEYAFGMTIDWLEMLRRGGAADPPLLNETED